MYPPSFLCQEAKIKQRTALKKELCKIRKYGGNMGIPNPFFSIIVLIILYNFLFFLESFEHWAKKILYPPMIQTEIIQEKSLIITYVGKFCNDLRKNERDKGKQRRIKKRKVGK